MLPRAIATRSQGITCWAVPHANLSAVRVVVRSYACSAPASALKLKISKPFSEESKLLSWARLTLVPVKTKQSQRTLNLPDTLVPALKEHRKRQLQEKLLAGSAWQDSLLVFTTTRGTPIDPPQRQAQARCCSEKGELATLFTT